MTCSLKSEIGFKDTCTNKTSTENQPLHILIRTFNTAKQYGTLRGNKENEYSKRSVCKYCHNNKLTANFEDELNDVFC